MALIFLQVLIGLALQVLSFTMSNCCDFIVKNGWPSVQPINSSIHWIITFGRNAAVLSQAVTQSQKQFLGNGEICTLAELARLFLLYWRKPLKMLLKTVMCQPMVEILNIIM